MIRHRIATVVLSVLLAGFFSVSCSEQIDQPLAPTGDPVGMVAKATQRPVSDFVNAQGLTSYFVPPVKDFMGWYMFGDSQNLLASVDYAGLTDQYLGGTLGTKITGSITERPLPDGRAYVSVNLHVRNTMMYILEYQTGDFATDPLLFGNRGQDVANGMKPAIGDAHFEAEFINTAPGAPLPDFMWAQFGYFYPSFSLLPSGYPWPYFEPVCVRCNITADGPLHAAAGLGPYGTPGRGRMIQVNLRPFAQQQGTRGDLWPIEVIDYKKLP